MGRCGTSNRGKSRGRKEGETKRGRAKRKTKGTRSATRRTSDQRKGTDVATSRRVAAEKAEMVRPEIRRDRGINSGRIRFALRSTARVQSPFAEHRRHVGDYWINLNLFIPSRLDLQSWRWHASCIRVGINQ